MTCSLTQSVRITNAKEFAHIFKKGQYSQSQFWKLVANNSGNSFSRLGLAISKKDYKSAVDRNHLNRLVRETFRKKIIKWDNLIFDYVTVSKKNVLRGFHFNSKFPQAKFVIVLKGKILDYKNRLFSF